MRPVWGPREKALITCGGLGLRGSFGLSQLWLSLLPPARRKSRLRAAAQSPRGSACARGVADLRPRGQGRSSPQTRALRGGVQGAVVPLPGSQPLPSTPPRSLTARWSAFSLPLELQSQGERLGAETKTQNRAGLPQITHRVCRAPTSCTS